MRGAFRLTLALFALTACGAMGGGRQIEVRTGPEVNSDVSIHLTNNLTQAVNVYVVSGGTDIFVKQVGASSTEHLPVQGVASGSTVTLKAVTVDGQRTYTRDQITLSGMYAWKLP